ncbi:glutamine--fructose-6-phosphate transaminase (isomerizing) [Lutibaculum baratangense]|uniref:Glutamine--fructose-6-phosphate aminotransferase [isomerizing] n=1 Tax=Lutibaculum baratangense AMV1 TaxID=631454 RepID=V4TL81_9HYPH|nr:glutamine--fructose-6-phosphate transaminase (isomerizing) [Lutibaculum baratangense]ESR26578.1 Glucosamine--fructose-6-phosphate aminotransferase [Lutibaculum baratangense AMV1]
MCGIVGILGKNAAAPGLVEALRRLEYRGYDSAGIATAENGTIRRLRAEGKLHNLADKLAGDMPEGKTGIGHTRWATHGAPTERNAHPHMAGRVALVHNGIIENFAELKRELSSVGAVFETDTDTEVVAHLLARELDAGKSPKDAMQSALGRLHGAFSLAVLIAGEEDLLLAARRGSPLAIGHGDGEMFLGSDALALSPFTSRVTYLEDGDWAVLTRAGARIFDATGEAVERPVKQAAISYSMIDRGNYRHFMSKEIHEQPEVVSHTLARYLDMSTGRVTLPEGFVEQLGRVQRLSIAACGTAYLAGLVGKYWMERYARLPVDVDIASEFRYREPILGPGGLSLFISQSGETADTLSSLRYCREAEQTVASIVNVEDSTIARESDLILPTLAGPEIGVASTKAFTCQLSVLAAITIAAGRVRGVLGEEDEAKLVRALIEVPRLMTQTLRLEEQIEGIARELSRAKDALYLGRGMNYPIALEGALKLKEISYIHAEGYAAGELKHGPIALVDENMPIVVIAPSDMMFEKTVSNMQEVAARGGRIVLLTDAEGAHATGEQPFARVILPRMYQFVQPLIYALPMQLLAYHAAVSIGTDVDQPRNLAKSVTVE